MSSDICLWIERGTGNSLRLSEIAPNVIPDNVVRREGIALGNAVGVGIEDCSITRSELRSEYLRSAFFKRARRCLSVQRSRNKLIFSFYSYK